ncbi:MAG TPA: hypothetical protein VN742_06715 [Candidatus Binataceae bacterium]|nr:hypothetical protein [Candidatus Binataceae bacterium]
MAVALFVAALFAVPASALAGESDLVAESDLAAESDVDAVDDVPLLDARVSVEEEAESELVAGLRA